MKLLKCSSFVSGLVLTLALAAGRPAQAQFGFHGIPGSPSGSQFGLDYETGAGFGITPFSYGSCGGAGRGALAGSARFPPCLATA